MKILLWHVHGSWTTAFVQGGHEYVVPVLPDRGSDGVGRARTWRWPDSVTELPPEQLADQDFDVVVLQRPHELELVQRWLRRPPGRDLPAVYLEHNAPDEKPCTQRHPLAGLSNIPIVHVTYFNELFWDNGIAPTSVIEHGIVDPGNRYTGELTRGAVVVNEAGRRGRIVGADLVPRFAAEAEVDVFGMKAKAFADDLAMPASSRTAVPAANAVVGREDLETQDQMHTELAKRRVYLHPMRWTSLGLSLIEAMQLGMPVVAVASTEAVEAVPPDAGILSTDVDRLVAGFRRYLSDPEEARAAGAAGRAAALERYGLDRFLSDWDKVLNGVIG